MNKEDKAVEDIQDRKVKSFKVHEIRDQFPILGQHVHDKPLVYLDNAATTQKPFSVIRALERYYEQFNSNVHRALYTLGEEATQAFEDSRKRRASS